jgi:hypothetical protein
MNSHNMLTVISPDGVCKRYINGRRVSAIRWDLCEVHCAEKDCYSTQRKKDGRIFHRHCARGPISFATGEGLSEYSWEYTNTFSGEANYSWVQRGTVKARSMRGAAILAKRAAGLNGVKCERDNYGDQIALRPRGMCTVLFIS